MIHKSWILRLEQLMSLLLTFSAPFVLTTRLHAQETGYKDDFERLWSDPELEDRISTGIEENRKGWATVKVIDGENREVSGAKVSIRQDTHDFLFGANIFMLDGYADGASNQKYENAFKKIFNFASVPFYWKDLEPEQGEYRYEVNSEPLFRRPPPDRVVQFCKENNIIMKGHTLVWDSPSASIPKWAPTDKDSLEILIGKRIESIAKRYKDDIPFWDVANESFKRKMYVPMPEDYVFKAFKEAERHFTSQNSLIYNEVPETFLLKNYRAEYSYLYVFVQSLLSRGVHVDGIGLQFHLFPHIVDPQSVYNGTAEEFKPQTVLKVLDTYGQLGVPLNISEITFPSLADDEDGRRNQAKITRNFYRLFFSHPMMEAITWWNVPDGKSWGKEGGANPGLLDENLNPKPSYEVLDQLINKEWRTNADVVSGNDGRTKFKGFYGQYTVTVTSGDTSVTEVVHVAKNGENNFEITLP